MILVGTKQVSGTRSVPPRGLPFRGEKGFPMGQAALVDRCADLDAPENNPCLLYLATLGSGSRPTMLSSLRRVSVRFFAGVPPGAVPWCELRHAHMHAIRSWLAEQYAPATANRILCALRGILKHAFRLGLMGDLDYRRAIDVPRVRGFRLPAGRALSAGELRALFVECNRHTLLGIRNAAALAILYGCGLRRDELVGLGLEGWQAELGAIRVHGKGNKERLVYPPPGARMALARWLESRGLEPGPLFLPTKNRGRELVFKRMSHSALLKSLNVIAHRAGVPPFTPHDVRRTFVGDMLDAGADLATVQALAGHANPTTTARYDRRGERTKAEAAELLFVPFEA